MKSPSILALAAAAMAAGPERLRPYVKPAGGSPLPDPRRFRYRPIPQPTRILPNRVNPNLPLAKRERIESARRKMFARTARMLARSAADKAAHAERMAQEAANA